MADTVVKENAASPEGAFQAEAAGLRWLADAGGARVAGVVGVGPHRIELERIPLTTPSPQAARSFGRALAVTHRAGASAFGAKPDDWDGPVFIGRLEQPSEPEQSWGRFYARQRVLPFLDRAVAAGNLAPGGADVVRDACRVIASGAFDDGEPPARLHGDLWNGNVLYSGDSAVLIDPAAHGGHRETDLAMLALFGVPYFEEILGGYDRVWPLRGGWRDRLPVHQLHPLAVHAVSHGPSYGAALTLAARKTLALAGHPDAP